MKRVRLLILVLIGVVGIIKILGAILNHNRKDNTSIAPEFDLVSKRIIEREVVMQYEVEPASCVEYLIPAGSELKYFDRNKVLYKKGELVFQVANPEEDLKFLEQKLNIEEAQKNFEMSKKMLAANLINLQKYYADSFNLEKQRLELKKIQTKLNNLKFVAPFDGYIENKNILNTDVLVHTPITIRYCSKSSVIKTWIPQSVIGFFNNKSTEYDSCYTSIITPLNIKLVSKAMYVAFKGIEKDGETVFEGIFYLPDTNTDIKQGMSGELSLTVRSQNPLLSIPLTAVRGIDKPYAFFINNGKIIKKYVHLGLIGDKFAEIRDTILPSDTVITGPPSFLDYLEDNPNVYNEPN